MMGAGVLLNVHERFLDDVEEQHLAVGIKMHHTVNLQIVGEVERRHLLQVEAQRGRKVGVLQRGRPQLPDVLAHLLENAHQDLFQLVPLGANLWLQRRHGVLSQESDAHVDGGQGLRQVVVQIAGHAVAGVLHSQRVRFTQQDGVRTHQFGQILDGHGPALMRVRAADGRHQGGGHIQGPFLRLCQLNPLPHRPARFETVEEALQRRVHGRHVERPPTIRLETDAKQLLRRAG